VRAEGIAGNLSSHLINFSDIDERRLPAGAKVFDSPLPAGLVVFDEAISREAIRESHFDVAVVDGTSGAQRAGPGDGDQ
jgi:hypothetical protein